MADFAPPTGPPPPRVPEGWKAIFNDQYKEWFFVNIHTKQSQWDKPTSPAYAPGEGALSSDGGPPGYSSGGGNHQVSDMKKPLDSNNPYGSHETDEDLARRLQAEENSRNSGHSPNPAVDRGASDSYYQSGTGSPGYQNQSSYAQQGYQQGQQSGYQQDYGQAQSSMLGAGAANTKSTSGGGFLGKLKSKLSAPQGGAGGYPQQQQYGGGYSQQQGYGGYPQQQQYGGGYGGGGMYGQPARKKPGMGVGGAAALGVGGGLLGGMLLEGAMDGGDGGGDGGGDYGGGDGGGDFGGGDGGGGD